MASGSRLCAALLALAVAVFAASALQARTIQIVSWEKDINYLAQISDEELLWHRTGIEQIREGIEHYIRLRPDVSTRLPEAPARPWGVKELREQVSILRDAIESLGREDTGRPFKLGMTTVTVTAEASPLAPITQSVDRELMENINAVTVGTALDFLPGVSLSRSAGRNEATIRIRGFSSSGQISTYLDGIPLQVPYDGRLDFNRFLTSNVAEIQVAKGYSSPLMGANNLGGSINIVTRQPQKKFEMNALIGTGTGEQLLSSFQLGSRWDQFYFQGAIDWFQQDYLPLSGNFLLQNATGGRYQTTFERNRSSSRDAKYSGRVAWTPREQDHYVFSYTNQKGKKGVPLYAGPNLGASHRFWDWPHWNKTGYYLITNTGIGAASEIRARMYYDEFNNALSSFDNDTYTTMNTTRGFYSVYDDHSLGFSTEFTTRIIPRHTIGASFSLKDDTHNSFDILPRVPVVQEPLAHRNQTFSIGLQDIINVTSKLRVTLGLSIDHLKGLSGQQRLNHTTMIPLVCLSDPDNDSFSGCVPNEWTWNPQISASYSLMERGAFFVTFADRGRFPTMMETYSSRFQRNLPNPDLRPEHSRNLTVGYYHYFARNTFGQVEFFRNNLRDAINSVFVTDRLNMCPGNTGAFRGLCGINVNISDETHEGFELSLRSTPVSRLTVDASYSYLNRGIWYDFASMADVNVGATSVSLLPTLPRNKVIFKVTGELPRNILAMANFRHEGGLTLQDSTYALTLPEARPWGASHSIMDISTVIPVYLGMSLQLGVNNLFDENYYYTAGYPETGRSWFLNARYRF
ncbi:MAG TPA: TonB-dependent receptor [Acidobacteriota bacterium]|nr:TonB-dependent receptor [Acidobacteriota bacterium]